MTRFTHFNPAGEAHMVDIGGKPVTRRVAVADGRICMHAETLHSIQKGSHKKGDVLGIARIAGIAGAKKTSDLVPLCHSIPLTSVQVEFAFEDTVPAVYCKATVETLGQTGAEMEALTAVQIALLTIYDMCKAKDRGMTMQAIGLVRKSGGKSGDWERDGQ
ncbi:MAG: cyclic pyranopterin monophosphate synthase MoaC [Gammaproteobacteria bacterium]|nr:cyclic pyranopterin monophosphate synthase MoaC [Gammaproteobacteria bacterium]